MNRAQQETAEWQGSALASANVVEFCQAVGQILSAVETDDLDIYTAMTELREVYDHMNVANEQLARQYREAQ